ILVAFLGAPAAAVILLALLAAVPASDFAIAIVNRDVARLVAPRRLPRLELKGGVPEELRTLVVVPTLLSGEEEIARLIERLEVHSLASSAGDFRFALLSDWTDAATEGLAEDEALLAAAAAGIAELNARHGPATGGGQRFLLLHRRRAWNEREDRWIGWERKRGKLHELNRLLRGASDTTFLAVPPEAGGVLARLRYVITLAQH